MLKKNDKLSALGEAKNSNHITFQFYQVTFLKQSLNNNGVAGLFFFYFFFFERMVCGLECEGYK